MKDLETSGRRMLKLASATLDQEEELDGIVDSEYAEMIDTAIRYDFMVYN